MQAQGQVERAKALATAGRLDEALDLLTPLTRQADAPWQALSVQADLLKRAGFEVVEPADSHLCCGSAGTYNLLQPTTAEALGRRKAAHIDSTAPDVVAAGNIGCLTQLRRYVGAPMVHTVELLDWATGGPLPPALDGVALASRPAPVREEAPPSATSVTPAEDGDGFW